VLLTPTGVEGGEVAPRALARRPTVVEEGRQVGRVLHAGASHPVGGVEALDGFADETEQGEGVGLLARPGLTPPDRVGLVHHLVGVQGDGDVVDLVTEAVHHRGLPLHGLPRPRDVELAGVDHQPEHRAERRREDGFDGLPLLAGEVEEVAQSGPAEVPLGVNDHQVQLSYRLLLVRFGQVVSSQR